MATAKVKQFWTAFISVLFALLASVGLASTAAAQQPAVQQPEEPVGPAAAGSSAAAEKRAAPASVPAQRAHRLPLVGDRSLPPTIKQRIAAEAHGSSPATRNRSAAGVTTVSEGDEPAALTELALAASA
ncbi:DUF6344 domain-containing protein [Streptomyces sp. NPDC096351]|uniref:DUF6344 domain-containing protein n=1 Tax=Streptomyces sp. NPDC096351 TaxID=3366087 RepID=UPI0038104EA3